MIKEIKLVSLNLWKFKEWKNRLPKIISLLKELKPDIICTQETQLDISENDRNQLEILNNELKYPYSFFGLSDIRTTREGVLLPHPVSNGLGILSNFPFTSEIIKLAKTDDGKEQRILLKTDQKVGHQLITITNLHFTNSDIGAELHFKETLEKYKNQNIKSILIGDFNIKDLSSYQEFYSENYISSSDQFNYVSYPEDSVSYDHILIPRSFSFTNFDCIDEKVSDHRMIVGKIRI